MKLQSWLPYCIYIFAATQLIQGENTLNCPRKCHNCRTGYGRKILCTQYCSDTHWCGITKAHRYIDCTSCKTRTTSTPFQTEKSLNSDDKKQAKFTTTSQELSEKDSQSQQPANTFLKYLFPIFITIVIIILIIILVRKYTPLGKKLSFLSPFRYSNLL